jgi:hypothetical protein
VVGVVTHVDLMTVGRDRGLPIESCSESTCCSQRSPSWPVEMALPGDKSIVTLRFLTESPSCADETSRREFGRGGVAEKRICGTELVSVLNVSWAYQQVGRIGERPQVGLRKREEEGGSHKRRALLDVEGSRYPASARDFAILSSFL